MMFVIYSELEIAILPIIIIDLIITITVLSILTSAQFKYFALYSTLLIVIQIDWKNFKIRWS